MQDRSAANVDKTNRARHIRKQCGGGVDGGGVDEIPPRVSDLWTTFEMIFDTIKVQPDVEDLPRAFQPTLYDVMVVNL
jgi:hypothetical protein